MPDPGARPKPQAPLADTFTRLLDGVQALVREHMALARVEMKQDLQKLLRSLGLAMLGAPIAAVGWATFVAGVAFALPLPRAWSLCLVGVLNLAAGLALTAAALRRARAVERGLPRTRGDRRGDERLLAGVEPSAPVVSRGQSEAQPL